MATLVSSEDHISHRKTFHFHTGFNATVIRKRIWDVCGDVQKANNDDYNLFDKFRNGRAVEFENNIPKFLVDLDPKLS